MKAIHECIEYRLLDEPGENHEDDGIDEYDDFIIVDKDRNEDYSDDNEDDEQISENGE
jgi:hypothetical protein